VAGAETGAGAGAETVAEAVAVAQAVSIENKVPVQLSTATASVLVKGYFVMVIASVSQRSNLLKIKRLLRQKTPRNDCNFNPKPV
jgi:hypothetical protein